MTLVQPLFETILGASRTGVSMFDGTGKILEGLSTLDLEKLANLVAQFQKTGGEGLDDLAAFLAEAKYSENQQVTSAMTRFFSALDASKSIKAFASIMALGTFFNDLKTGTASGTPAQKATFWGDLVRLPGAAADVVKFGIDRAVSSTNACGPHHSLSI